MIKYYDGFFFVCYLIRQDLLWKLAAIIITANIKSMATIFFLLVQQKSSLLKIIGPISQEKLRYKTTRLTKWGHQGKYDYDFVFIYI